MTKSARWIIWITIAWIIWITIALVAVLLLIVFVGTDCNDQVDVGDTDVIVSCEEP